MAMSEEEKAEVSQHCGEKKVVQRIKLSEAQRDSLSPAEWSSKWLSMESFIDQLEEKVAAMEVEGDDFYHPLSHHWSKAQNIPVSPTALQESHLSNTQSELSHSKAVEEQNKVQVSESQQRERILIRRIATKDQEIQDYMNQLAELKAAQAPGATALRSALLDPAVNLLMHRLRQEITTLKTKLEETQNELSAWKFTPDSNTGKRLMAKCRLLYQENEELGRVVSSGRLAFLESDLALQKSLNEEMKKSQAELDSFLQEFDEDEEGMQTTIYYLQQELKKANEALAEVQKEKAAGGGRTGSSELRTGAESERLTNGKHSAVVCGRSVTTESDVEKCNKVNKSARTNHNEKSSDSSDEQCSRKRTFKSEDDDNSMDSDSPPVVKKERRGSELSLDYNEDELCLTNGETKTDEH